MRSGNTNGCWILIFFIVINDELLFGVITVDINHKITWINCAARQIIEMQMGAIPDRLPDELKAYPNI